MNTMKDLAQRSGLLIVMLVLGACALGTFEQDLKKGEKAVIFWAVEKAVVREGRAVELDPGFARPMTDFYSLHLSLLPVGPGDRLVDADGDRVRAVPDPTAWSRTEDREIDWGGELEWKAATVEPGTYTLVRTTEIARFVFVGFERWFESWLLVPPPENSADPNYVLNDQAPSFTVSAGEHVYIGTFVGNVISRSSNLKSDEVTKEYKIDPSHRAAIAQSLKIDNSKVRTVDLLSNRPEALRSYSVPQRAN